MCVEAPARSNQPTTTTTSNNRLNERKAKSRDAARERRARESEYFQELEELVAPGGGAPGASRPLGERGTLDKTSLIRLAVAGLKCRDIIRHGLNEPVVKSEAALGTMEPELSRDVLPCLDGFTLVVGADGEIVYTSGNIQQLMGLTVEEVVGHQLVDFIHPCDQVMR